ncbi:SRPBCC family protein [Citricoccus sp. SGAir0253]|uniref:SRPBCC family protein n=1 Tax=Citricoccus sp. SGAir0253 TaxID=2567881 RepID=UPI0010CCEEC0|nr:SRPBCC family protein [Citricoccus sp. SGAir0253]QCU79090.1 SRPBCC family protein [Citricoccus sp. SGAir0253]
MKPLSVVTEVRAPAATVWEVLADLEGTARVLSGVTSVERLSADTGYGVGTSWRETRVMLGREASEVMTVTAMEPGRRTEIRAESHGMRYETVLELLPVAGGAGGERAQLVMRFRGEPVRPSLPLRLLAAVTAPLGAAASRRAMRQDLADIAAEAERRRRA